MVIKRVSESDDRAGQFINEAFTDYAIKSRVDLNFEEYCFAAENDPEYTDYKYWKSNGWIDDKRPWKDNVNCE